MYTGKGEGRVWPGAFIYCFSDVKMHARGRGAEYLTYLTVHTLWMAPRSCMGNLTYGHYSNFKDANR